MRPGGAALMSNTEWPLCDVTTEGNTADPGGAMRCVSLRNHDGEHRIHCCTSRPGTESLGC